MLTAWRAGWVPHCAVIRVWTEVVEIAGSNSGQLHYYESLAVIDLLSCQRPDLLILYCIMLEDILADIFPNAV